MRIERLMELLIDLLRVGWRIGRQIERCSLRVFETVRLNELMIEWYLV